MNNSESTPNTDRAAVRGFPPLFYAVSLAVSLAIHFLVLPLPFTFPATSFVQGSTLRIAVGILVGLIGVIIDAATIAQFRRTGNDTDTGSPTMSIMTAGPYRFSRNPLYLGVAFVQTGIAIGVGSFWALASVIVALLLVNYLAVLPEEEYLEGKFGDEYREYRRAVRRWI